MYLLLPLLIWITVKNKTNKLIFIVFVYIKSEIALLYFYVCKYVCCSSKEYWKKWNNYQETLHPRCRTAQLRWGSHGKGMHLYYTDDIKQQQMRNMVSFPLPSMAPFTFYLMWQAPHQVKHRTQYSLYKLTANIANHF